MIALNRQGGLYKLLNVVGLVFDPELDANRLPVVKATTQRATQPVRQAKTKSQGTARMGDGKLYARSMSTNESGAPVYVLDSENVVTETNVPTGLTKYDREVFKRYKQALTGDGKLRYKHFDLNKYRVIKLRAYSQAIEGKPISARQAAQIKEIKELGGCGERYLKDYYKAMNEAQRMYESNPSPGR